MTDPARAQLTAVASGRTVAVTEVGLTFGGADADIPLEGVAEPIAFLDPVEEGFIVTDTSDRCAVNARPVIGQRLAQLGDTIRVAGEAFVLEPFVPAATVPAPEVVSSPPPPEPSLEHSSSMPEPATPMPVPSSPTDEGATPARPRALARLEVLGSGILAGRTFPLVTRLTLVGRGAHNDVVLDDDTVSDSHAKIVRRAAGWFVLDQGSSNGTYVAGRRIDDERGLAPGSEVRFGGIKVRFEPLEGDAGDLEGKATRQVVARPRPDGVPTAPKAPVGSEPSAPQVAVVPPAAVPPAAVPPAAVPPAAVPPRPASTLWRALLGWLLVTLVVLGSGAAGYLVAAMLRGGR